MKSPRKKDAQGRSSSVLRDLLTLEKLMTGSIAHLVYWCGLGLIILAGFAVVGGSIGYALREPGVMSFLLTFPVLVAGLLVIAALALLWRSFCEFYVVIVRMGEDLNALRRAAEAQGPLAVDEPAAPPAG